MSAAICKVLPMLNEYYPSAYAKSVFHIDYDKLRRAGYNGIIFDIDNTLVHHGDPANPEIIRLFEIIRGAGLETLLLSDNSRERVESFARAVGSPFVADAGKPDISGYQRALDLLGTDKHETIAVGDRIFTDILGANRFGIDSILVHYIKLPGLHWPGFRRFPEKAILILWTRRRKKCSFVSSTPLHTRSHKKRTF